jgi:ligand-binding sensor domain-containing protein
MAKNKFSIFNITLSIVLTLLAFTLVLSISSCMTLNPQQDEAKKAKGKDDEKKADESSGFVKVKGEVLWEKTLLSNEIRCVAADDKNVWVATDRGVCKLSRKNNSWAYYTKAEGLASDDVKAVATDGDIVWFATSDGVSRYEISSGKWKSFKKKDGLASDKVQCIAVDDNYIWFGTDNGINRYDKQIDSWALRSKKDGLSTNNVVAIAVEGEYVWVGTQPEVQTGGMDFWMGGPRERGKPGAGVNRYHRRTDSWNAYSKTDGLADDKLKTIAVGESDVWFGTSRDGVSVYSKTDQTFVKTYSKTDVLTSNKIESIAVDGSQIWIATANAGAQRYLKTVNTWVNYSMADGLASNHVTWISVHGNEVWFATYESGLSKYDKVSNKWVTYVKADSLADDDLKVVKADAKGNIWVGTALGLSVYDPKKREWSNYKRKDGLITDYITDVEIRDSSIWVGTNRGVGVMDEKTKKWKFYTYSDGLNGDFTTAMVSAGDNLWVGTQKGLCKFNSADQKWYDAGKKFSLSEKMVTALAYDGKSLLWVGTEEGIWKYNLSSEEATHYSVSDGMANNYVNSIAIGDDEVIYIGTQGGLSIYKDGKFEIVNMEIPSKNILSSLLDGKTLWLGTMSGLVKYETDKGTYNLANIGEGYSQRNIRSICINGESMWIGTTAGLLQVKKSDGLLMEEYRTSLIKEPLKEPGVSNIEFDGNYVWFSNWSSSPNGAIVRFDRNTKTWRRFTREDILLDTKLRAPTEVRRILVTSDFVWFATNYGVMRYDKKLDTWKRYTMEDGLAANDIRIMVESTKSIWICAVEDIAVSRYHKETGKMEFIEVPSVPGQPQSMEWLECMEADGPDLWLGFWSRSCGVKRYNEDTDTWYFYTRKEGLTKTGAQWISADKDRVWVSHGWRGGLSYFEKATEKWYTLPSNQLQGEPMKIIVGEKSVWVIVQARGPGSIARYDKSNTEWTTVRPQGGFMGDANDIVEDGDYVWLSTFNDGVNRFHMASGTWMNFNDRNGLLQNHVNERALKADDKYVWVGTPRGLSIYDKETETWASNTSPETLIGNEVRSVVADERYVWCGTSQGLSRYDKRYDTWTNFRQKGGHQYMSDGQNSWSWWEPEDENSLVNNDINSLAVDDKYLWVGTKGGASRYDKIADSWDRYNRETGLPNNNVVVVVVDGYDVWAGTGAGLCKYPRMSDDKNAWITYTSGIEIKPMIVSKDDAKSMVSDEIWSLAADGKYVWVGTRIGVSRYDKGRDVWNTFTRADGMSSDAVSGIAVEDGRIWFGSDNGITMFDKSTNDWTIMTTNDGLSSDRIKCIASDSDYVWFGTFDSGISRYNKKTKKWDTFNKKDGLAHNSVISIATDGDLVWIGTNRGLSRYDKTTGTWTTFTQFYGPEDL